jgi:hypothetical protein
MNIFNRYLYVIICKARKINKLFGYKYNPKLELYNQKFSIN